MSADRWRMGFHLMPPVGWMNDPNGLCQLNGTYHVYHQYEPTWPAKGGERGWGHFTSTDLVRWQHHGMVVHADEPADASGAYSGSALVMPAAAKDGSDAVRLYYTGNVKEPGDHDYIYSGRQANTILIESDDGLDLGPKQVLLRNEDYPSWCCCHVRDPKLWREDGSYWMLLGARDKNDRGRAFVMRSEDGLAWEYAHSVRPAASFGFMWECPDRVELDGREWLSFCPQGMAKYPWANGLRDQSGYLPLPSGSCLAGTERIEVDEGRFHLWDQGFEFYAPQTFVDEKGRTILIGWMGLPEHPWSCAPDGLDWIHCLTVPRVLAPGMGDAIRQQPVEELQSLRGEKVELADGTPASLPEHRADIVVSGVDGPVRLSLDDALEVTFRDGRLTLRFKDEAVAAGRTSRSVAVHGLNDLRVLVDSSAVEVYANQGDAVLSTRWFPAERPLEVTLSGSCSEVSLWPMGDGMVGTY